MPIFHCSECLTYLKREKYNNNLAYKYSRLNTNSEGNNFSMDGTFCMKLQSEQNSTLFDNSRFEDVSLRSLLKGNCLLQDLLQSIFQQNKI